jgi:hypothetical protein
MEAIETSPDPLAWRGAQAWGIGVREPRAVRARALHEIEGETA